MEIFLASIDIWDANLHIPNCQGYQHFAIRGAKVLTSGLALLRQRGISVIGYMDDLLLLVETCLFLLDSVEINMHFLQDSRWILNLR